MNLKGKTKRILAGVLGILMMLGLMPATAFAATSETGVATFDYCYQSDGTNICYWASFSADGYTAGDTSGTTHRCAIYVNGDEAYCIEPGVHLLSGDTLKSNASERWNALSADRQNGVKTVLAFGKPGNSGSIGGSAGSQSAATQVLVWEMTCGIRDPKTLKKVDDRIINSLCAGGHNQEVLAVYNNIVAAMTTYHVMPSFADGSSRDMTYENGQYVLKLTDTNGVLSSCTVTASNSNVKITKSGNTLTLTSKDYFDGNVTISFVKSTNISANAQLVAWGDPNLQDVITGIEKPDDVTASFKVATPGGNLDIVKTSEDGNIAGITMTVSGKDFNQTVKTDANGKISLKGLVPGTYTVTEHVSDYYEPQDAKTITITAGQTTTVSFSNVLKKGTVSVAKNSEDQFNSGVKFHLYGTSASGQQVDLYATTNDAGIATFENVLIAGNEGYTLEEVDTAVRYVIPKDQTINVFWQEETSTVVPNILKKFNVTVNKSDAETGAAQGDAKLAGAVYGLYEGDTLVEQLVTDENGHVTSGYHVCGDNWTVKEITPSEGYLLDETVYPVGASAGSYEVEFNSAPAVDSPEQVIKGQISIIKHHDDGSTQIETPEEGAEFQIYLTSAGSYDSAKESERDTLTCDEDGFAISKWLPYGMYTVHQTKGFPETEFMKDFTVFICKDGQNYKYLINNAEYAAYIKVVKADAETGATIPLSGAGFEIYDASGQKVEMSYTYPTLTTIDTYYVSDDGTLLTPEVLPAGDYSLVEVQAPYGYVLDSTPIPFTVTRNENEELEGLNVITVTAYDTAQKGVIRITKSGEVFYTVNVTGDEVPGDKDGKTTILTNCVYTPVYEVRYLAGATYQVIAAEDIYTGDGTLRVAAGTLVAEITTGDDGAASTQELYLGRYTIVETKAPEGCVLNTQAQDVTLTYAGQEVSLTSTDAGFVNDRQKVSIDAEKVMEQSQSFGIGMNGEVTAVSFGLYAGEDIMAADGSVLPIDGLIEIAFADENGHVAFNADLPFGHYYVKELSTNPYYAKNMRVYSFDFNYAGQEIALQEVHLNNGEPIVNELLLGRIEGVKVDEGDAVLEGAVFGLFAKDTEEFTMENALLTDTTDSEGRFAFDEVPLGDYVVVEIAAPEGYVLSDARHFVALTYDEQIIGLKVIDYPIFGSIELTKYDADYPDNHLSGAVFHLYADTDGNGEFDAENDQLVGVIPEVNDGVYRLDEVAYGSYFVKEETAPEGFLKDENIYAVSIVNHGETVLVENEAGMGFKNQVMMGEVTVFKTDKATGSKLVGAGFRVFDADGYQVAEGVTGEDGTVTFKLRYGKYTVAEYQAPEGYVLDDTPLAFEIKEDGQALSFDMENLKITGKLVISKADADTEKLLPNAGFRIYDVNGEVVKEGYTNSKGICEFTLEFGKYYYQEFDAPDGYEIDDTKYEFSITEDGKVVSVVMTNKKTPTETPKDDPKPTEQPKTETVKTDSPKTGDESNVKLWTTIAAIAAVGGIALIGLSFRKKGKRKGK